MDAVLRAMPRVRCAGAMLRTYGMVKDILRRTTTRVLMMSPYNISSRHDRVIIAADEQQQFVASSAVSRRLLFITCLYIYISDDRLM